MQRKVKSRTEDAPFFRSLAHNKIDEGVFLIKCKPVRNLKALEFLPDISSKVNELALENQIDLRCIPFSDSIPPIPHCKSNTSADRQRDVISPTPNTPVQCMVRAPTASVWLWIFCRRH